MNDRLVKALGLLLLVMVALLSFAAARYWQSLGPSLTRLPVVVDCDLHAGPCSRTVGEGSVSFAIEPLVLMQPLRLSVSASGLELADAVVEIRGLNMDMGLNRTRLSRRPAGHWEGETVLPICSQRTMEWEAAVRLEVAGEWLELPFPFRTRRP